MTMVPVDLNCKISVIIPTHNRPHMLQAVLSMVNAQSWAPHEVIVVQNGAVYLPDMQMHPGQPTVIHTVTNAGPGQARNIGATWATGDYCAFLDDDDFWDINYLENVASAIVMNNYPDMVLSKLITKRGEVETRVRTPPLSAEDWKLVNLFRSNPGINGSSIVVKRSSFLTTKGFDARLLIGEDKVLVLDFLEKGLSVCTKPEAICYYVEHDQGRLTDYEKIALQYRIFAIILEDRMGRRDYLYLLKRSAKANLKAYPHSFSARCKHFYASLRYALSRIFCYPMG